jgi:transcriptional regulator with PAS, ATPase and Fis domain
VNCGAIPAALIESELFGYETGTFTGGNREGKAGKLEEANGGTLFLDEVSELSPQAQTALLRVLQESEVVRLGGNSPRGVDVRVVVATNKHLGDEVAAGRFRQDLFFRLHVLAVDIPPLRDRRGDVAILAHAFLADAEERVGRSGLELSQETLAALAVHPWPGNVRELKNAILRAAAVAATARVEPGDLRLVDVRAPALRPVAPQQPVTTPPPLHVVDAVTDGEVAAASEPDPERDELAAALESCGWNIARTSTTLGVSRMTLYRRLRKYGITR